jgi:hypothetical protein
VEKGRLLHTPLSIALTAFPLSIATMIFRPIDYVLFVMFLTPQFVLISLAAWRGCRIEFAQDEGQYRLDS